MVQDVAKGDSMTVGAFYAEAVRYQYRKYLKIQQVSLKTFGFEKSAYSISTSGLQSYDRQIDTVNCCDFEDRRC